MYSVCLPRCSYVYTADTHTHTHTLSLSLCLSIYIYIYLSLSLCKYMHVCMHACMHACMHVCMYACMYVRVTPGCSLVTWSREPRCHQERRPSCRRRSGSESSDKKSKVVFQVPSCLTALFVWERLAVHPWACMCAVGAKLKLTQKRFWGGQSGIYTVPKCELSHEFHQCANPCQAVLRGLEIECLNSWALGTGC